MSYFGRAKVTKANPYHDVQGRFTSIDRRVEPMVKVGRVKLEGLGFDLKNGVAHKVSGSPDLDMERIDKAMTKAGYVKSKRPSELLEGVHQFTYLHGSGKKMRVIMVKGLVSDYPSASFTIQEG